MAIAAAACAAAAVLALALSPAVRASLRHLWEGDAALAHGAATLAVVAANLATARAALTAAVSRGAAARRTAAVGAAAAADAAIEDLDLCLLASEAGEGAAWAAARARKRALLEEAAAVSADAEAAYRAVSVDNRGNAEVMTEGNDA